MGVGVGVGVLNLHASNFSWTRTLLHLMEFIGLAKRANLLWNGFGPWAAYGPRFLATLLDGLALAI